MTQAESPSLHDHRSEDGGVTKPMFDFEREIGHLVYGSDDPEEWFVKRLVFQIGAALLAGLLIRWIWTIISPH